MHFCGDALVPALEREEDQTPITNVDDQAVFEEVMKDRDRQERGEEVPAMLFGVKQPRKIEVPPPLCNGPTEEERR